jgi:hypothetical protein
MKSYLQGRRALETTALRAPSASSLTPGASAACAASVGVSAQVNLVKQGDKIVRIIVQCPCGEHTEIECLYPPGH